MGTRIPELSPGSPNPAVGQVGCLYIRDFFVAVERLRDVTLAGRPVAIGHPGRLAVVSREIRARGIAPGTSATQLATRCPDAAVVAGRIEPYLETAALADEALWRAGVSRAWHGLGECLFEPTSVPDAAGGIRRFAECAMTGVTALAGLETSCGIADTIAAARATAHLAEPRGLIQVLPGYDSRFLAPLDVSRLDGIDESLAERLGRRGITRIGMLATCSPEDLHDILGRAARPLVGLARGHDPRGVGGRVVPTRLVRTALVEGAPRSEATLRDIACALADDVWRALADTGWRAGTVTLRRYGVAAVANHGAPAGGHRDRRALIEPVQALLATPAGFQVSRITVAASNLRPPATRQARPGRIVLDSSVPAPRAAKRLAG